MQDHDYDDYLDAYEQRSDVRVIVPLAVEFDEVVQYLSNWKAAGSDRIYNFFIKKLKYLHCHLYNAVSDIRFKVRTEADWLYMGITHFTPKGIPPKGVISGG